MGHAAENLARARPDVQCDPGSPRAIVEKFRSWSDCGGEVERRFTKDELLTNITIYWATGAINSSFWPYYARSHQPWPIPDGARIDVPTARSVSERDRAPAAVVR